MTYYVLVRGPLGVGKTTVSRKLAEILRAKYISVDRILDDYDVWYSGRLSEFLQVSAVMAPLVERHLKRGISVIIDGNFYWKTQIKDLERRLNHHHFVFTLKAPLSVCINRDRGRVPPHGSQAARKVYARTTRFDFGIGIDAMRPLDRIVGEIVSIVSDARRRVQ